MKSGKAIHKLESHKSGLFVGKFDTSGRYAATGSYDKYNIILN